MLEFIKQPWPWYVAGPMISLVMFLMLYFGKAFGVSSTFRQVCSVLGAGNKYDFFKFDWKAQRWNLLFVFGAFLGGFISNQFLTDDHQIVALNPSTILDLTALGFTDFRGLLPNQLFGISALSNPYNIFLLILGGLLVGFGTRYAGGCTSGHAISGLSNLQMPSLVAVIGFFIGGLFMTHVLFPILF